MTTFDRNGFLDGWMRGVPRDAAADEFERLHAEIAALKARLPAPPAPETGWAVVDDDRIYTVGYGFHGEADQERDSELNALFFPTREDAEVLVRALGTGRAAELNRETLEEVG